MLFTLYFLAFYISMFIYLFVEKDVQQPCMLRENFPKSDEKQEVNNELSKQQDCSYQGEALNVLTGF